MNVVAELAATLVRIDSVNPSLVPGGAGERAIAAFVAAWLGDHGLEVEVVDAAPGRPCVLGTARGRGGGASLMLNAHLDTVGVAGMAEPFAAHADGGRLYGRGAYDMKGALAAAMLAIADAARAGLAGDVVLAAVADEELASLGTTAVLERVTTNAAIVCEPTELRVAVAHRGFVGFEIETRGVAAHGSRPDLGDDAILHMGPALVALERLDASLRAGEAHPLLGTGSLHAGLIAGGQEYSSYPARCLLSGERRTLPGETADGVARELASALDGVAAEVRTTVARDAFELEPDAPLVRTVLAAAGETAPAGVPFWADSALTAAAGIPTVLYGPAGDGAHAAVEWVDVDSLERCREVYRACAEAVCG